MAMDKDINELRNEINSIDREFVELFIKRMGVSLSVAEYKKKTGMPVLDRSRERELLNRVAKMSGDEMKTYTRLLYSTVLNLSRSYQHSFLDNTSVLTEKIPLLMCTPHQEGIFYFVPDKEVLRISTIIVNIYLK